MRAFCICVLGSVCGLEIQQFLSDEITENEKTLAWNVFRVEYREP